MLKPSDQFMLLNRSVQPFPDVMPDRSRLFKMAGIVRFRPFLHDVMTLGIIKPSGSFKTQMHFGTSFNALFFQRPAVNEAPFKAMLSHMFVVLHLPAFSQFPQLLFLLSESQASGILFRTSPLGIPGVIAPEILFRCTVTEQERKLLHVLATAEKNDLQAQESERKQAVQKRIEGKKQRRERNHRLFLAAGLLIEAGLVDTKTGELCYKKDRILQALKELKYDLETSPNPDA